MSTTTATAPISVVSTTVSADRRAMFDLVGVYDPTRLELRREGGEVQVWDRVGEHCLGRLPRGHAVVRDRSTPLPAIAGYDVIGNGSQPARPFLSVSLSREQPT